MLWLLAGIAVLWFAVASAGFRRLLAILAGVAVVGTVLFLGWLQIEQNRQTKEAQAAKLRIPRTNVELVDLRMGTDSSSVQLSGRVRNNDPQFTLTNIELRLRVEECPAQAEQIREKVVLSAPDGLSEAALKRLIDSELAKTGTRCETVGDSTESISIYVPPGQSRELKEYVSFSGIGGPRSKRSWHYDVVSISGEKAETR